MRRSALWIVALVSVALIIPLLHQLGYQVTITKRTLEKQKSPPQTFVTTHAPQVRLDIAHDDGSHNEVLRDEPKPIQPEDGEASSKEAPEFPKKGYPFGVIRPPALAEWSRGMLEASTRMMWGKDYNEDARLSILGRIKDGTQPRWGSKPHPLRDDESAEDVSQAKLPANDYERNCKNWGLYGEWNEGIPTRKIYYGTLVNDEVELLAFHLDEIAPAVDVIVVTEGNISFRGHKKPYHVQNNFEKFRPFRDFADKIRLVHWTQNCPTCGAWSREHATRNHIKTGMSDIGDDDIVVLSDTDEVPSRDYLNALKRCELSHKPRPAKWTMDHCQRTTLRIWRYWYYFDCTGGSFHTHGDLTHGFCIKNWTMQELRMGSSNFHGTERMRKWPSANTPFHVGWHVHNFLPPQMLINKHRSYSEHGVMPQDDRRVDQMRESCDMPPLRPIEQKNEKGEWRFWERLWMHNSTRTRLPKAFYEHPDFYESFQHFFPAT